MPPPRRPPRSARPTAASSRARRRARSGSAPVRRGAPPRASLRRPAFAPRASLRSPLSGSRASRSAACAASVRRGGRPRIRGRLRPALGSRRAANASRLSLRSLRSLRWLACAPVLTHHRGAIRRRRFAFQSRGFAPAPPFLAGRAFGGIGLRLSAKNSRCSSPKVGRCFRNSGPKRGRVINPAGVGLGTPFEGRGALCKCQGKLHSYRGGSDF
jgi:hypothetical protein